MCSLNWQHQLCKNPRPNPDIKTLFTDHTCAPPNGARASPVSVPLAAVPKAGAAYPPLTAHTVCLLDHFLLVHGFYDVFFLFFHYAFIYAAIPTSSTWSIFSWLDGECSCLFICSVCCCNSIINTCSAQSRYASVVLHFC